jgi:hypothetical protein
MALLLRYENAAWRRYDTMLKVAKASAPQGSSMPEVDLEQGFADQDAAFDAEVQALIATKTPHEVEEMLADARIEMSRLGYAVPNEPDSEPVASRPLNRHQRRRQASQARKG